MPLSLSNAVVYDIESFPNVFTLAIETLYGDTKSVWEISEYRDDRVQLFQWFDHMRQTQTPMIGFNILHYDYPVIHYLYNNPNASYFDIYLKSKSIVTNYTDRFSHLIWQRDRFAPQIDLFKINHFDNKAKTTSLKALQINMRSDNVLESPVPFDTIVGHNEVGAVVYYNGHDTGETKQFAHFCMDALNFRIGLMEGENAIHGDVMNMNDTKIGEQLLVQRIGEDVCYDRSSGRKVPRQTIRTRIVLSDIIFPYIWFDNPEFNRVLSWLKQQTLKPEDIKIDEDGKEIIDENATIKTKGVFKGLVANVGDLDFYFGTGGMHASVSPQRIVSDENNEIVDVDVKGYYPDTAIKNKLAPAHLGEAYTREYSRLPIEREEWQKKKGKKCVEANSLKLSGNGVYGKSNSPFSVFYDPQYTMSVTINCQLLLCMLAERLLTVPTLRIIQANTDGITYYINRAYRAQADAVCKQWEAYTLLTLEYASYKRMWIRDVNNYVAEDLKGKLKQKGAYWHPDPMNYAQSISESQPPAWHKDLGNCASIMAAVATMVHGIDPEMWLRAHTNKFDFMMRAKVPRGSKLMLGNHEIQGTSRYYVSKFGDALRKISPPAGPHGEYKRANKIGDYEYNSVMAQIGPGVWDARIHTKNKSKYEDRISAFEAGWKCTECNEASNFSFTNLDYRYYAEEARKLII